MIVKRDGKWRVYSKKGKPMGGPYPTIGEARKRLAQAEAVKHTKKGK